MQGYKDSNPLQVEKWIESLNDSDRALFDKGYELALEHLLEEVVRCRVRIFRKMLNDDPSLDEKRLYQSRIGLLDQFEEHYSKRVNQLETA